MTLAAYCCWVISPRYFYHIYNRWGSQTTEGGKQSLPLWEDSPFLPCKEKKKHKAKKLCYYFSTGTCCAGSLFFPVGERTEVEWAEGRRTEEKAQGKPCANVNQHRTNYHGQNPFLIELGTHRSSGRNTFYHKWTQYICIKTYKNFRLRYHYQDFQKYLRKFVFHIGEFLFNLCLCSFTHLP